MKLLKLKCENCGTTFIASDQRWHIDYCPCCHESWVDLETHYCRWGGKLRGKGWFESPWFDDEDEYHSALLTWLQDSDEDYILEKDHKKRILTIIRQ